jgi:predicted metal-dependent hydrolase
MVIHDKVLGEIRLVKNLRARRIIVTKKDGFLQLTYPPSVGIPFVEKTIEEMRPRLASLLEKGSAKFRFSPQANFGTYSFALKIVESLSTTRYYTTLKDGMLSVSCPAGTDFNRPEIQEVILRFVEKALRYEANRLLPTKVHSLAEAYGFSVSEVKINKSRSRWGSCSSRKNINLSFYCMLLPGRLIEYVILHELCHTVEMNHSERFWQLLDKVSGGKSGELRKELKTFKSPI